MTPAEPRGADLQEIKARHEQGGWDLCTTCVDKDGENSLPWPCDAWIAADHAESLAAEVARRTEALEAAEAWMTHVLGILTDKGHLAGRIPDADCREDGRMILEWLRAALGTKGAGDGE